MVSGTIITNANQSVQYYRLLARNASTDIDAVYFNPAGLAQLDNGWHIALHNQTIFQEKTVISSFPFLNNSTYVGEVNVPIFPTFFAVYKADRLALSFGFGPNSGGGTADFTKGLPSFETPLSLLPASISALGIPTTQYSLDMAFKGKSVYYGFQGNVTYAFNETISGAVGFRYILARNTYEGYIRDIMVNPLHPLLNPTGSMMSAAQFFTLVGRSDIASQVGDMTVNVDQKGSGFTPILSLNVIASPSLNIGIRYEFNTKLTLENETNTDDTGMFPDGEKARNDIPAILSAGVEYSLLPELRAMVSFSYFFDKNANWEGREELIDNNTFDFGIGFEYDITDTFLVSAGYLHTQVGVKKEYQTDFSHELNSDSLTFGGRYKLYRNLDLDFGVIYVNYHDADTSIYNTDVAASFLEKYQRTTWGFAIGLGYRF